MAYKQNKMNDRAIKYIQSITFQVLMYQLNEEHDLQSKQPWEHQGTESLIYQDSGSLDENHDPIDYSNVPPGK